MSCRDNHEYPILLVLLLQLLLLLLLLLLYSYYYYYYCCSSYTTTSTTLTIATTIIATSLQASTAPPENDVLPSAFTDRVCVPVAVSNWPFLMVLRSLGSQLGVPRSCVGLGENPPKAPSQVCTKCTCRTPPLAAISRTCSIRGWRGISDESGCSNTHSRFRQSPKRISSAILLTMMFASAT